MKEPPPPPPVAHILLKTSTRAMINRSNNPCRNNTAAYKPQTIKEVLITEVLEQ